MRAPVTGSGIAPLGLAGTLLALGLLAGCPSAGSGNGGGTYEPPPPPKPKPKVTVDRSSVYANARPGASFTASEDYLGFGAWTVTGTVKSRDDDRVTVSLVRKKGDRESTSEERLPLRLVLDEDEAQAREKAIAALRSESLTVAGIAFDCRIEEVTDPADPTKTLVQWTATRWPEVLKRVNAEGRTVYEVTALELPKHEGKPPAPGGAPR